jgi:ATP-binding cassette subfamily F protein uup
MNYLSVEKLSKTYGEKQLFDNISFGLEKGQKMALIARNGTGKSTLLNIIAGIEEADSGTVTIRNGITVSYLPQLERFENNLSVLDVVLDSKLLDIQVVKEYESCLVHLQTEHTVHWESRMEKAMEMMDRLNLWDFESKVKGILSKFGLNDIFANMTELSGGQRKKAALAKTLLSNNDLLILDEPTNHLDIEMIEWLEEYLTQSNLSLLMVTHDRYFLDKVCEQIIELENGKLFSYKGKYDYYLEKKTERIENEAIRYDKIRLLYRKELEWVHTSPQARTTKAKARINAFENLKEEVGQKKVTKQEGFKVQTERLGNKILEINNIDFSYDKNNLLIKDFSYIFKKGEKCGVVGKNGSGKTSFLKLIMKELKPDAGKITPGQTIQFGYFSQDNLSVVGNKRMIDMVKEKAEIIRLSNGNYMGASQFLKHFGFKYEQQYTYYEDLSGGEKRKLHLLITLMQNPNFLILDEPTNDFDIDTLNLLEDFLINFEGCLLIVSHDRWFMNKLAEHLFVFEGNGNIKDYYGNYTEYRLEKEKNLRLQKKQERTKLPKEVEIQKKIAYNKLSYKEKKELEQIEIEIILLESERSELTVKLTAGQGSVEEITTWSLRYQEIENMLEEKSMRWFELEEKKDN